MGARRSSFWDFLKSNKKPRKKVDEIDEDHEKRIKKFDTLFTHRNFSLQIDNDEEESYEDDYEEDEDYEDEGIAGTLEDLEESESSGYSMGGIIGTVIGMVLLLSIGVPIANSVIDDAVIHDNITFTGTTLALVNLMPMFLAIGGILVVFSVFAGLRSSLS